MEKNDLTLLLGFLLMVLGGIVYFYVPSQSELISDILVVIGFSVILYVLDFSSVENALLGIFLTLIAVGLTIILIIVVFNNVLFFREHKIVFVATIGMVLPRVVAITLRHLLGIDKPDI